MSSITIHRSARRGALAAVVAGSLAALLAACSGGAAPSPSESTGDTGNAGSAVADPHAPELADIKIAGIKGPNTVPVAVAINLFAADYGLNIEFVPADNAGVAVTQVVSGDAATASSSYFGIINAIVEGLPLKVIAESYASTPGTAMLMALPSSGITSIKDLAGKTVNTISLTSSHTIKLRDSMLAAGLDPDSVNWVELPYSEVPAALEQGTIDASSAVGPVLAAVRANGGVVVFDYADEPYTGMAEAGFVASNDFITKYPNTVAALQCVLFAGQRAVLDDRDLYNEYFQSFLGAPAETAAADVILDFQTTNNIASLNRNVEVYQGSGLFTEDFDFADHTLPAPTNC